MSTILPWYDTIRKVFAFFVLLFLSGLWFPIQSNSGLAQFASFFPIRHFITAVFAPFNLQPGASPWAWHDLLVLAIWGVAGLVVAMWRFSWAPRRSS